ncbi:MAG: GIY-YIG nuclease family protein [Patescibacteria group bacterium]
MDEFTVYVLRSKKTGRRYIGYTFDIQKRLLEHNDGINRSTIAGIPWEVLYTEAGFKTRKSAQSREKEIKSWKGGVKLRDLLQSAGIV